MNKPKRNIINKPTLIILIILATLFISVIIIFAFSGKWIALIITFFVGFAIIVSFFIVKWLLSRPPKQQTQQPPTTPVKKEKKYAWHMPAIFISFGVVFVIVAWDTFVSFWPVPVFRAICYLAAAIYITWAFHMGLTVSKKPAKIFRGILTVLFSLLIITVVVLGSMGILKPGHLTFGPKTQQTKLQIAPVPVPLEITPSWTTLDADSERVFNGMEYTFFREGSTLMMMRLKNHIKKWCRKVIKPIPVSSKYGKWEYKINIMNNPRYQTFLEVWVPSVDTVFYFSENKYK